MLGESWAMAAHPGIDVSVKNLFNPPKVEFILHLSGEEPMKIHFRGAKSWKDTDSVLLVWLGTSNFFYLRVSATQNGLTTCL